MSPMAIGWIVFALVFGSALLAMFLHSVLPEEHLSSDSKDVVKLGITLVATMSALVLSLLVASAKSAFDTRSNKLCIYMASTALPKISAKTIQPIAIGLTISTSRGVGPADSAGQNLKVALSIGPFIWTLKPKLRPPLAW